MAKQIFVNLPVKDLKKSIDFFSSLGFSFDIKFTDDNAGCLIIGKNIYAMLLNESMFKTFIPGKKIADSKIMTEVLVAISAKNRQEVDMMISKAIQAGGGEYREISDYGWMYGRAFTDLDGHIWEVLHMDESKRHEQKK